MNLLSMLLGGVVSVLIVTSQSSFAEPINLLPQQVLDVQRQLTNNEKIASQLERIRRIQFTPSRTLNKILLNALITAPMELSKKRELFARSGMWSLLTLIDNKGAALPVRDAALFSFNGARVCLDSEAFWSLSPRAQLICYAATKNTAAAEALLSLSDSLQNDPFADQIRSILYDVPIPLNKAPDIYDTALFVRTGQDFPGNVDQTTFELFAEHISPRKAYEARRRLVARGVLEPQTLMAVLPLLPDEGRLGGLIAQMREDIVTFDMIRAALTEARKQGVTEAFALLFGEVIEQVGIEVAPWGVRREIYLALYVSGQDDRLRRMASRANEQVFADFLLGGGIVDDVPAELLPPEHVQILIGYEPYSEIREPIIVHYRAILNAVDEYQYEAIMDYLVSADMYEDAQKFRREMVFALWSK